ncbi:hypothetical protein OCC_02742 [Thermococcus litoralis DSM 5473]|uniref:DUF2095 domain-containing protein n=1 Tax=Thermococcus litoralis (strain ATCC 51850 / DSM 5473 / JCM 8560 / NS-C) TaxID=523849 RepID=H3ZQP1_THELN|nr:MULTISPECIES: DUF2095 family protein [Thermococcus]EHR77748.1 hypothetical protein OCC_02742 [Thermococcus litoralis DSM 5473]MPW39442.1 DUF2095 domain-containing protein [Thermococcus sp. 101 C5]
MVDKKKKRPIDEFPWQEYDKEEFKEKYPHLAKELEEEPGLVIEGYRVEEEEEEELMDFSGYNPTVIDFIRRCETDEEALEIINWMEEHGEITPELAKELRIKLVKEGVRSFGTKKEWGWYERHRKR